MLKRVGAVVRYGPCCCADRAEEALPVESVRSQAPQQGIQQFARSLRSRPSQIAIAHGGVTFCLDQRQLNLLLLNPPEVVCVDVVD